MKRFEFKLQAVLTLRQRAEHTALEQYAAAIRNRQQAAERLVEIEMQLSESRRQWLNGLADGCAAVQAAQILAYSRALEERRQHQEQTLHRADEDLNLSSHRMLFARQQREAVERYLARLRQQHDRQVRLEEAKILDDLVNRRPPVSFSGRSAPSAWT